MAWRDLAGEEEVEEALHRRHLGAGDHVLLEGREGLGDGLAAEADAFLGIEVGDVGHEAAHVARAADRLADVDLVDHDLAEFLVELLGPRAEGLDLLLQYLLQRGLSHGHSSQSEGLSCLRLRAGFVTEGTNPTRGSCPGANEKGPPGTGATRSSYCISRERRAPAEVHIPAPGSMCCLCASGIARS